MRNAISPRFAMTIFSRTAMTGLLPYDEKGLVELNGLAVFDEDCYDSARCLSFDLVEHLHRFDDAHGLTFLHLLTQRNKWIDFGAGRGIKSTHHRRTYQ